MDFASFRSHATHAKPAIALVLGSGLGQVVQRVQVRAEIAFAHVPGFAAPTVHGHGGRVLVGEWVGVPVLIFQGRMHYYEGHPWDRVTASIRLAHEFRITTLLLTNAAGGIRHDLNPGDLMVIRDHLELLAPTDWKPKPPSPALFDAALTQHLGKTIPSGVYAGLTGPCYETPAEIRALRAMGADAVGMSTVKEAIAGVSVGMRVAAISCITNKAAGLSSGTLDHSEVQEVAGRRDVVERLAGIIETLRHENFN
jgi:purine-nucleoside phosphorylase